MFLKPDYKINNNFAGFSTLVNMVKHPCFLSVDFSRATWGFRLSDGLWIDLNVSIAEHHFFSIGEDF